MSYSQGYFGSLEIEAISAAPNAPGGIHATLAKEGFVDRNGNSFAFPGLSMDLTLASNDKLSLHASAVDSKRLASDTVRILLEAMFDAAFKVPADARATAVKIGVLPAWQSPDVQTLHLDQNASRDIVMGAMRGESLVTAAMGEAIRGGALTSLNNETLAAGVETAAGVIVKKIVEHEAYCYFKSKATST